MMDDPKLTALRSIRTKFGLVTACMLLVLLSSFYLGGRYILVQMIRQAEQDIRTISADIKDIVFDKLKHLQKAADRSADMLSRSEGELSNDMLQTHLGAFSGDIPINLAIVLTENGMFKKGCSLFPGEPLHVVEASEIQSYFSSTSSLLPLIRDQKSVPGLLLFRDRPTFFAISPITPPSGQLRGFLVLGSLFHNATLISQINAATPGMQVSIANRPAYHVPFPPVTGNLLTGLSPIFHDILTYPSGGRWHVGENAFEAVMPINDILGHEVTAISIRLPGSFSSLANIALGWLTTFIACVGMVFVLPIFWLQTRIVLNPLSKLIKQIRKIGEQHLDGDCEAIRWPKNDEFGMLAKSVNEMLAALARKTRQNAQTEQRQRALVAGMPDCLCVFDTQANVVTIHKQPDYTHPLPGLLPGRPISPPLFPDNDCEALKEAIAEAFRTERIQMVMLSCREVDGSYRHFETRISRMDDFFALVILRDVTKEWRDRETREQVEERLSKIQKMESLGTLAAGIAHDFNNILAIIQNTAELTWENPSENEREAVATIRQATSKGAALTRELMTYAGHTRISFKREDPNTVILDLEKLMNGVIASNVILELKLTPSLPQIDVDPHQFWKVIINLLKNASEAMNGSSGHIRISTYPFTLTKENTADFFSTHTLSQGRGVVFQIDDTGSGIPKEVIGRMFEPFFSTKAVGRGLGLATVFGIVDVHNGGIAIVSEPGKGTSFRVWLPVAKNPDEPPAPLLPPPAAPSAAQAAPHAPAQPAPSALLCVLLVEDDPSILQSTTILLRSLGVSTLAATSKREALALFRKHADSISLILLDAQIGSLDNVRLLSALRLRKTGVPTVIISGHTEEKIREMFKSEAYEGFLSKPYTRSELKAVLTRFASLK